MGLPSFASFRKCCRFVVRENGENLDKKRHLSVGGFCL